jgi:hypothetical protein
MTTLGERSPRIDTTTSGAAVTPSSDFFRESVPVCSQAAVHLQLTGADQGNNGFGGRRSGCYNQ